MKSGPVSADAPREPPCYASLDAFAASGDDGDVSTVGAAGSSAEESVVLAAFENRNAAERMLRSLGREFRQKAHSGDAAALVISGNADGSLKLTQSRVVTASGVGAAVAGVSVAMMAGLLGTLSALKGAKSVTGAAHTRASHVGGCGAGAGDPRSGWPASGHRTPSLQGPSDTGRGGRASGQPCKLQLGWLADGVPRSTRTGGQARLGAGRARRALRRDRLALDHPNGVMQAGSAPSTIGGIRSGSIQAVLEEERDEH